MSSKIWITQDIIQFWKIFSVCYAEQTSLENSKLKSKGFSCCQYSWIFQYVHLPKGVQHIQPCSLFFTATCRILLLSYKFGNCWNKLYSAFHICIYPDMLKSLSVLVITRNGKKERLVFNPRSPMSFSFLKRYRLLSFSSDVFEILITDPRSTFYQVRSIQFCKPIVSGYIIIRSFKYLNKLHTLSPTGNVSVFL